MTIPIRILCAVFFVTLLNFLCYPTRALASSHLTEKQLEALARWVGKTYWIADTGKDEARFFAAPSPAAPFFIAEPNTSFEITSMVEAASPTPREPYYEARFESGKQGYISTDTFLEGFNTAFLTYDPQREKKRKAAWDAEQQRKREEWIRAQPWPAHFKEAALKGQPAIGMNMREVRAVLGKPTRVVRLRTASAMLGQQQQWIYEGRLVLTFTNGVITRAEPAEAKNERKSFLRR